MPKKNSLFNRLSESQQIVDLQFIGWELPGTKNLGIGSTIQRKHFQVYFHNYSIFAAWLVKFTLYAAHFFSLQRGLK